MNKKAIVLVLILVIILFIQADSYAQCAMCRAVTESNIKSQENTVGQTLNSGILYLLAVPYLLFSGFIFAFFRKPIMEKVRSFHGSIRIF